MVVGINITILKKRGHDEIKKGSKKHVAIINVL